MKTRNPLFLFGILILVLGSLSACKAKETPAPTLTPFILPTDTVTPLPSETPLPTETPLPSATPTPSVPIVIPKDINVNCRHGFGVEWAVVGSLFPEHPATLLGRNLTSTWWYVELDDDQGTKCWVKADVTELGGSLASIRPVEQSESFVSGLTIADPETIVVPGCLGPIDPLSFKGTVEMNGPGTASWHFESEQTGVITDHATDFSEARSKPVEDSFTPPLVAGTYWFKLVVYHPNEVELQGSYTIECP